MAAAINKSTNLGDAGKPNATSDASPLAAHSSFTRPR